MGNSVLSERIGVRSMIIIDLFLLGSSKMPRLFSGQLGWAEAQAGQLNQILDPYGSDSTTTSCSLLKFGYL